MVFIRRLSPKQPSRHCAGTQAIDHQISREAIEQMSRRRDGFTAGSFNKFEAGVLRQVRLILFDTSSDSTQTLGA